MANTPYYSKAEADQKNKETFREVENTVNSISAGEGGKSFATLADAQAVSPVPTNGTVFQVENSGYYIYDSASTGGTRFLRGFADGVVESGSVNPVSGDEVFQNIRNLKANSYLVTDNLTANRKDINNAIKYLAINGDLGKFYLITYVYKIDTEFRLRISEVDSKTETVSSSNWKYVATINVPLDASSVNDIITINYDEGQKIGVEAVIDLSQLQTTFFESVSGVTYSDCGIKEEFVRKNKLDFSPAAYFENSASVINSSNYREAWKKMKKAVKEIVLNRTDYDYNLILSQFVVSPDGLNFLVDITKTFDQTSNITQNPAPYVMRGSEPLASADNNNLLKVNLIDTNKSGLEGYMIIDLSEYYDTNNTFIINASLRTSFLDSGIIKERIKLLKTTNFNSIQEALSNHANGTFTVGRKVISSKTKTPTSFEDYESTNNKRIPIPLQPSVKTPATYYEKDGLGLRLTAVSSDDWFYFCNRFNVLRTQDLSTDPSTWEVLFTNYTLGMAAGFGGSIYGISGVHLINDETELLLYCQITFANPSNNGIIMTENAMTSVRQITVDAVAMKIYYLGDDVSFFYDSSFSEYSNRFFLSDYSVGNRTAGKKVLYSSDGGYTFSTKLDLKNPQNYELDGFGTTSSILQSSLHIHSIAYDKYWERIWLSIGDGATEPNNTSMMWSDDLGETWKWNRLENDVLGGKIQSTPMVVLEDCIVMGTDDVLSGCVRINKTTKDDVLRAEKAFEFNKQVNEFKHLSSNISYRKKDGQGVYVMVAKDTSAAADTSSKSTLVATWNGVDYFIVWKDVGGIAHGSLRVYQKSDGTLMIYTGDGNNGWTSNSIIQLEAQNWE